MDLKVFIEKSKETAILKLFKQKLFEQLYFLSPRGVVLKLFRQKLFEEKNSKILTIA